jgi:hypothetical protein
MSELDTLILTKLEKVETDVGDIKISIAKNTTDLEHHIKRTDDLQVIVEDLSKIVDPLYQEHISKKAVEDFKKKQREDLVYKLKLPGYVLAALAALATFVTWLVHK